MANNLLDHDYNSSDSDDAEYIPPLKKTEKIHKPYSLQADNDISSNESLIQAEDCGAIITGTNSTIENNDRINKLWEDFKSDTNTTTKLKTDSEPPTCTTTVSEANNNSDLIRSDIVPEVSSINMKGTEISNDNSSYSKFAKPNKHQTSHLKNLLSQKMKRKNTSNNILENSKTDWKKLKIKEDISTELSQFNKNGYIEKQNFLKRCEDREYTIYRDNKIIKGKKII